MCGDLSGFLFLFFLFHFFLNKVHWKSSTTPIVTVCDWRITPVENEKLIQTICFERIPMLYRFESVKHNRCSDWNMHNGMQDCTACKSFYPSKWPNTRQAATCRGILYFFFFIFIQHQSICNELNAAISKAGSCWNVRTIFVRANRSPHSLHHRRRANAMKTVYMFVANDYFIAYELCAISLH